MPQLRLCAGQPTADRRSACPSSSRTFTSFASPLRGAAKLHSPAPFLLSETHPLRWAVFRFFMGVVSSPYLLLKPRQKPPFGFCRRGKGRERICSFRACSSRGNGMERASFDEGAQGAQILRHGVFCVIYVTCVTIRREKRNSEVSLTVASSASELHSEIF